MLLCIGFGCLAEFDWFVLYCTCLEWVFAFMIVCGIKFGGVACVEFSGWGVCLMVEFEFRYWLVVYCIDMLVCFAGLYLCLLLYFVTVYVGLFVSLIWWVLLCVLVWLEWLLFLISFWLDVIMLFVYVIALVFICRLVNVGLLLFLVFFVWLLFIVGLDLYDFVLLVLFANAWFALIWFATCVC